MGDRLKFQGVCYQQGNGCDYMRFEFDSLQPEVRERLRYSPYNICAACVAERASTTEGRMKWIADAERHIAEEEGHNQLRREYDEYAKRPDIPTASNAA